MSEPVWMQFLTPRDKEVFAAAGYGARAGWGKRPALLIIDVNYNFCGDKREPIVELDQALAQFLRRGRVGRAAGAETRHRRRARARACR